jgi:hypothetical protein
MLYNNNNDDAEVFLPELTGAAHPLDFYSDVEVAGCVYTEDGDTERVDDAADAQFWSVFLRLRSGGAEAVADLRTFEQASRLADALRACLDP